MADVYRAQQRYSESEPLYLRTLEIQENVYGPDHQKSATTLYKLAEQYAAQRRYADAKPLYERALVILENTLGSDHPKVAKVLDKIEKLHKASIRAVQAAQQDYFENYGAGLTAGPDTAIALHTRAIESGGLTGEDLAINYYHRSVAYPASILASCQIDLVPDQIALMNRAIADLGLAIELNPDLVIAYKSRGAAYVKMARHDEAIADFNVAIRLDPDAYLRCPLCGQGGQRPGRDRHRGLPGSIAVGDQS